MWTIIKDPAALDRALALARGCYQRELLLGGHNLSGSSLKGRAKQYGARYAASRASLLSRLTAHGVAWSETAGPHNRRVLVIGESYAQEDEIAAAAEAYATDQLLHDSNLSDDEFAALWLAGEAGDYCRQNGVQVDVMRAALKKAWSEVT